MRWSRLKQITESRFASEARGRVELWITQYRYRISMLHEERRSWITIDGIEIVNMSRWNERDGIRFGFSEHDARRFELGVFEPCDLTLACRAMLTLSIDDALASTNPLVRSLAVLDVRCGKRRRRQIDIDRETPLVAACLRIRMQKTSASTC